MPWNLLMWLAAAAALGIVFLVVQWIHLAIVLTWEAGETRGMSYYGRTVAERNRFKRRLRLHARLLYPIVRLSSHVSSFSFPKVSFVYREVAAPRGTCTEESFARAVDYSPRPDDVFVVTQMKCGTTWMQHVVYEVLNRGNGDIVESGRTLYALSPWLEAVTGVPIDESPLIGEERPSRLIKTHLPARLCPYDRAPRYIYVARHPVSCFASCVDFIRTNIGAFAPDLPVSEEWFRSPELMWWGTWTDHVNGWWSRSRAEDNVLFVYFEDMRRDLTATVQRVAAFLDIVPLTEREVVSIVEKCGFAYMQRHKDAFEMNPPHVLQTDAALFVRGTADRHADVPEPVRQRLRVWCAKEMASSEFPLADAYADVARAAV